MCGTRFQPSVIESPRKSSPTGPSFARLRKPSCRRTNAPVSVFGKPLVGSCAASSAATAAGDTVGCDRLSVPEVGAGAVCANAPKAPTRTVWAAAGSRYSNCSGALVAGAGAANRAGSASPRSVSVPEALSRGGVGTVCARRTAIAAIAQRRGANIFMTRGEGHPPSHDLRRSSSLVTGDFGVRRPGAAFDDEPRLVAARVTPDKAAPGRRTPKIKTRSNQPALVGRPAGCPPYTAPALPR